MSALEIYLRPDGSVQYIYDDALAELPALLGGEQSTRRASHVEPSPGGGWTADMSPVGGPLLGEFALRSEALAAEREWLGRWLSGC